jgi:hypothetical protein
MRTVQAEINTNGVVTLLEPIEIEKRSRAKVIIYDDAADGNGNKGNAEKLLTLMRNMPLLDEAKISDDEMELQIQEARDSWD